MIDILFYSSLGWTQMPKLVTGPINSAPEFGCVGMLGSPTWTFSLHDFLSLFITLLPCISFISLTSHSSPPWYPLFCNPAIPCSPLPPLLDLPRVSHPLSLLSLLTSSLADGDAAANKGMLFRNGDREIEALMWRRWQDPGATAICYCFIFNFPLFFYWRH